MPAAADLLGGEIEVGRVEIAERHDLRVLVCEKRAQHLVAAIAHADEAERTRSLAPSTRLALRAVAIAVALAAVVNCLRVICDMAVSGEEAEQGMLSRILVAARLTSSVNPIAM